MNKLTPLIKGVITGVVMAIIFSAVVHFNIPKTSPIGYLIYLAYAAGITWTLIDYKRSEAYNGKFADLFGQGFRCFIVTILIIAAFTYIFYAYLRPDIAEIAGENYRADLIKDKNTLPGDIDELVASAKKHYPTGSVYFTIFGYLITGTIITAAGSALLMRRK
jgi:hypothetical protein